MEGRRPRRPPPMLSSRALGACPSTLLAQVRYVVCSDATPVASTYEGFRTGEGTRPSTLLAQVRYVVPCVAMRRQSRRRMKGFEQTEALVRRPCWRKFATSCRV
jgi:hypothetical protein